jgi:hypothetical protein
MAEDLDQLGARHKELLRELAELKPKLHAAIRAARAAKVSQVDLMQRSGYRTVQQIRVITGEAKSTQRGTSE